MERTKKILGHLAPHSMPSSSTKDIQEQLLSKRNCHANATATGTTEQQPNAADAVHNKKTVGLAHPSPFLQGGFTPVRRELDQHVCLTVFGKLPADLDGMYCKNGPNSFYDPPEDAPYHWFDGDGMIHGVDIKNGHASYSNKWVLSKRLQQDKARGYSVYNMGALCAGDMSATLDERVMDSKGRMYGRMNTNVVFHGKRLLALEETDLPYHISTIHLETVGQYTMSGKLDHAMTAHPKTCPVTGEMFVFGHEVSPDPARAFVSYTVVGKDGVVKSTMRLPVGGPRFMHDMGLTQKYAIFIDVPAVFDFQTEGSPWTFDSSLPLRFGVLPRYSTNPAEIRWFEFKAGMIFHTVNAYDDAEDEVVIQCCRGNRYTMAFNRSQDPDNWLYPYEWTMNMRTGQTRERQLCPVRCDFPSINPSMCAKKQQFSYYATYRARSGDQVPLYDGLVKLDHASGKYVQFTLQPHLSCGEFVFVPKKTAKSEDDGYLVTFVYNENTDASEFAVFDAKNILPGDGNACCVCRVSLPQRVPYGFHGNWIPRKDLEQSINC